MRYESATSVPNIFKRWFCIYFSTLLVYDVTLTLCSLAHICVDDSGERWRTGYECNGSLSIYLYIYMGGGRPLAFLKQIQRHRTLNTNAFCLLPPWASGHEQFFFLCVSRTPTVSHIPYSVGMQRHVYMDGTPVHAKHKRSRSSSRNRMQKYRWAKRTATTKKHDGLAAETHRER